MTLRPIITLPDHRLRLVAKPIARVDAGVQALMDDMLATMYDAPGIGLAAPQIAVDARVIVLDIAKRKAGADAPEPTPDPMFLANPEILWASDELSVYEEGCLSIPEYFEEVERPARVRVGYLDRDGRTREIEAEGILAICLQHEIDHLNGVLFIDHISRLKRARIIKKFEKAAKFDEPVRKSAKAERAMSAGASEI
jgi:peptide deformylase